MSSRSRILARAVLLSGVALQSSPMLAAGAPSVTPAAVAPATVPGDIATPAAASATAPAAIATPATASANGLTLQNAQRLARERSRAIAAQDAAIAASREMAVAARQLPDPVLRFGFENLPADGADRFNFTRDSMTMRRVGVMQELVAADKRALRGQRADREAGKASAEKDAAIASVERDAALAWVDRRYAERMRALMADQAAEAELEIVAADGAFRAGRGGAADVIAARASKATMLDRVAEYDRRVGVARVALSRWVGDAGDAALSGELDLARVRIDEATLVADLAHHPQIAQFDEQAALADVDVRLARANRTPDWSVEVGYAQRGPAYPNMLSLGFSVPLAWDRPQRQDRELAARTAQVEQVRAQRDDALRAHVAEVRAMLIEWKSGIARGERYARELLPLARERTAAALAAYRAGKGDLASVLAARRNALEVATQALSLEMDTAKLWVQLNTLAPEGHETRTAQ